MTKYKEMSEAVEQARRDQLESHDRCSQYMLSFMKGLVRYCEIPEGEIEYLRLNKKLGPDMKYSSPEAGGAYSVPGAMEFNDREQCWVMGVRVRLGDPKALPKSSIFFPVCVYDEDRKAAIRIGGEGEPQQIDLNDMAQCTWLYDQVVEDIKQAFLNPTRAASKPVGFTTGIIEESSAPFS